MLGYVFVQSGRVAEGLPLLQEALSALEAMAMFQWRSHVQVHLGEAYLLARRPTDALAVAESCLILTRERGHRGYEAWTLRLLGEIASHHDRPDVAKAEAHYDAAVTLASELEMRPLVAHCHLGFADLCRWSGEQRKAQQHLTTATSIYRELDMRSWLEKAERTKVLQ